MVIKNPDEKNLKHHVVGRSDILCFEWLDVKFRLSNDSALNDVFFFLRCHLIS